MLRKPIFCAALAMILALTAVSSGVFAAEVDSGDVYCFGAEDFSHSEPLAGICITQLPDPAVGTLMLGSRVLRQGDILTAQQLEQMTFHPLNTRQDLDAVMTYLPIYENRVETSASVTVSVRGKEDKAPMAEDSALETYKNLSNEGALKVTDPEGKPMSYTVTRQPKRGEVSLREDGTFVYTPKKNKVGVDSFTYTATDPAGNVSREATVTITVLKPSDAARYSDTAESSCRFEAEWLKNTGLFTGEQLGGQLCFLEDKTVSRGEFLVMMVKSLGIPVEQNTAYTGYEDAPQWLQPYLAAALRAGLTAGLPAEESGSFEANRPITGGEAAVMLQNALDLPVTTVVDEGRDDVPRWAAVAVTALQDHGISTDAMKELTRGDTAKLLYRVSTVAASAPGLAMYQ